ncbi:MAG TPA: hypothetical protein VGZ25_09595 [Gemmataceae bacterium]|nr:hypothetical protein [Gemmataceae bacterium]
MVEDKGEPRELNWRQLFPWTELFQGFRIALDLNKLLLAAAGIVVMSLGWWVLANIFYYQKPVYKDYHAANEKGGDEIEKNNKAWAHFKADLAQWSLMHQAAGPGPAQVQVEDVADSLDEYERLRNPEFLTEGKLTPEEKAKQALIGSTMPGGYLRTLPWDEDRGPNPFLLVAGKAGIPWEAGHFWHWLTTKELPVLIEPLYKLFQPVGYFIDPRSGSLGKLYFLLVLLWTAATWALFGGAITRIAAVQFARQEKIGLREALRYTVQKYVHYVAAPIFPLIFVGILLIIMIVFGLFGMIPIFGDILVYGLFWPIIVLLGLGMAVALIGLVGWPMMSATISAEGTDSWEAVSRSYSYVFQAPWNFAWYCLVAMFYGAVVVFFVGFVGSLSVDLAKWGVRQTPFIKTFDRDPGFLFVYAPKSFGWRNLLLRGTDNSEGTQLVSSNGEINLDAYNRFVGIGLKGDQNGDMSWWNKFGAFLVSGIWLNLIFLLIIGFGYSFFWSSSTIIYMLMRRKVDDADLDEVYMEDDDRIEPPTYTPSSPPSAPAASGSTMVEAPALRVPTQPAPIPASTGGSSDSGSSMPASPPQSSSSTDGNGPGNPPRSS